ncbi:hypothetical protein QZH41_010272, partial [Actinostola sp. cb2023]
TGTGKTLSFALPVMEKLQKQNLDQPRGRPPKNEADCIHSYQVYPNPNPKPNPKVLVMAPTRELAKQVGKEFEDLKSELKVFCIYGGMPYNPQEYAIRNGLDVLVGTPGRILDFMRQGTLDLSKLNHVILDEVDRMLDMGFSDSVEEILAQSFTEKREEKPQTLLFSATLPPWALATATKYMKKDKKLVDLIGHDKVKTAETVQHMAIKCHYSSRASTIGDVVQENVTQKCLVLYLTKFVSPTLQVYCGAHGRTVIFAETKKDVNELALNSSLKQETQVLHGDIPQKQREMTLKSFREGKFRCLVATDVAARGLDIPEIDLVVQCEPPKDVDAYIHRSGRTGRAHREGICIVFYKPQQEMMGIKFKRIGAPQPSDIIKASAEDACRFLDQIPSDVLEHFREASEKLIDEKGAVDAVAAALAQISGTTEIKSRSLLSSQEGYTTYIMTCDVADPVRSTGYMWRVIENNLPPEVKPEVRGMRLVGDRKGVVFDVPHKLDNLIKESWADRKGTTLKRATHLPELLESTQSAQPRQNGYGSGGSSDWSRNGGGGSWGSRNYGNDRSQNSWGNRQSNNNGHNYSSRSSQGFDRSNNYSSNSWNSNRSSNGFRSNR